MKNNNENLNEDIKIYFENYSLEKIINSNVLIIKDKFTNEMYIQKKLAEGQYDKNIFDYLYNNPIQNIPKIIDIKRIDGYLIIIKEYIEGITLSDYLKNNNVKNIDFFYSLLYKLCNILSSLHNSPIPIIHRDIKPDNIIIGRNNEPYIIDLNSTIFYNPEKTADSVKLGTEGYATPEQYGFAASNPATDIYAMGCLIKYLIPFFDNKNLETKMKPIINKCCKLDFVDRYKNMNELKNEIYKNEKNYRLLAIPGYRSFNINHMIIASIFYLLIFYYCFFNINSFKLNLLTFIFIIVVVFTLGNLY